MQNFQQHQRQDELSRASRPTDSGARILTQTQPSTAATEARPSAPSSSSAGRIRSWQQVEQSLVEICRLSPEIGTPQSRGIQTQAEQALLNLLVDTQTAEELEDREPLPGRTSCQPTQG